jgi:crotonobetainyl-CoA:carnitine CoA-transferase CaiB-like acyl-CoA transferase
MRGLGGQSREPGMSPKFLHFNRNKRSIVLDLKSPDDLATLLLLVQRADVFVSNMRPKALTSLRLTWDALAPVNPRLIHCTITGFATGGPYEGAPAYDTIIQGVAGVTACLQAALGVPRFAPFVLCDHVVGLFAAQAIAAGLVARSNSGNGQAIEVPMFENMASFVLSEHLGQRTFDPDGAFGDTRIINPDARPLATRDGYICVSANTDAQAKGFFRAIDRPDLIDDPRFSSVKSRLENVQAYFAVRAEAMATRTNAEWLVVFKQHDVPAMQANSLADLIKDPQLQASEILVTEQDGESAMLGLRHANRYSESGLPESRVAPRLDQHREQILAWLDETSVERS